jgi:hypothetical protein
MNFGIFGLKSASSGLLKLRAASEFFVNCFMRAARDFDRQLH